MGCNCPKEQTCKYDKYLCRFLSKHAELLTICRIILQAEQLSFPLDPYKPAEMTATTLAATFKVAVYIHFITYYVICLTLAIFLGVACYYVTI